MKRFMCGMLLGAGLIAAPVLAQNMWQGHDSTGNSTTIYENSPGIYQWNDSRGHTGTMYQNSPGMLQWGNSQGQTGTMQQMIPAPSMGRNPC